MKYFASRNEMIIFLKQCKAIHERKIFEHIPLHDIWKYFCLYTSIRNEISLSLHSHCECITASTHLLKTARKKMKAHFTSTFQKLNKVVYKMHFKVDTPKFPNLISFLRHEKNPRKYQTYFPFHLQKQWKSLSKNVKHLLLQNIAT